MRTAHAVAALVIALAAGGGACGGTPPPSTTPPAAHAPVLVERPAGAAGLPSVSGTLRTLDNRQLLSAAMIMAAVEAGEGSSAVHEVRVHPDGTFIFLNVPPGRYEIRARGETEPEGPPLLATFRVTVDDRDIRNLDLPLVPGAEVAGTVAVEERRRGTPPFSSVRVRAPLADGTSFGDAVTGDVAPDGSFTIKGLMNGGHLLALEGLPEPWVMSRVTLGDEEITDRGFDVDGGRRISGLRITITDVASEVTGTVTHRTGAPAAGAVVAIVPASTEYWTRASRRLRVVRADGSGRYRVRGLPAGEYRVAATVDWETADVYRPDVLAALSERGTPLTLAGPEARVVDLTVASPTTVDALR